MIKRRFLLSMIALALAIVSCEKGDEGPVPPPQPNPSDTSEITPRLQSADLRPNMPNWPAKNQGARGTCTVFATTGLLEYEFSQLEGKVISLSDEYVNWAKNEYHVAHGTADYHDGADLPGALNGVNDYGICLESLMPYQTAWDYNNRPEPSQVAITEAASRMIKQIIWIRVYDGNPGLTALHLQQIKTHIKAGHPVATGACWISKGDLFDFDAPVQHMLRVPESNDEVLAAHTILFVGFVDNPAIKGGGYFIFRNSWGTGFGDNGYANMPYEYAARFCGDPVTVRVGFAE